MLHCPSHPKMPLYPSTGQLLRYPKADHTRGVSLSRPFLVWGGSQDEMALSVARTLSWAACARSTTTAWPTQRRCRGSPTTPFAPQLCFCQQNDNNLNTTALPPTTDRHCPVPANDDYVLSRSISFTFPGAWYPIKLNIMFQQLKTLSPNARKQKHQQT